MYDQINQKFIFNGSSGQLYVPCSLINELLLTNQTYDIETFVIHINSSNKNN